jgi:uncharacterized LabA/DUF88 family protein
MLGAMRSNCSLYIDAGYLLASAATRVTGTSLRNGIHVDYRPLIESLIQQAEETSGLPVLRVHWYDSAKDGVPNAQQERIGELPRVKLRLGRFGVDGQQKGVDLRIGLDLVAHARNSAADVFFLVSGDDDLTEAVEEAQVHGVQVVVLAVPNGEGKPHGVSRHLVRAADALETLVPPAIDKSVIKVEVPKQTLAVPPLAQASPEPAKPSPKDLAGRRRPTTPVRAALAYTSSTGTGSRTAPGYADADEHRDEIDAVVAKVVVSFRQSAALDVIDDLLRGRPSIPREIDRALLQDLSDALGVYDLSDPMRFRLRDRFWEMYDEAPS